MPRHRCPLAAALTLAATLAAPLLAQDKPRFAGPTDRGFLLPNGWTLSPAGEQITLENGICHSATSGLT